MKKQKQIRSDPPQKKKSFKRVSEKNCSRGLQQQQQKIMFGQFIPKKILFEFFSKTMLLKKRSEGRQEKRNVWMVSEKKNLLVEICTMPPPRGLVVDPLCTVGSYVSLSVCPSHTNVKLLHLENL